jgi:hypothetical protein
MHQTRICGQKAAQFCAMPVPVAQSRSFLVSFYDTTPSHFVLCDLAFLHSASCWLAGGGNGAI